MTPFYAASSNGVFPEGFPSPNCARVTSYFPCPISNSSPPGELTFSNHRSRSSRALAISTGSALTFSFFGRLGFSFALVAVDANHNFPSWKTVQRKGSP